MKRKTKLIIWLVAGVILAIGPVWGMIGTMVGMVLAFLQLGSPEPQSEALAGNISLALYTTAAGLIACPIGIVITIVSAIKLRRCKNEIEKVPNQQTQNIVANAPNSNL